MVKKYSKLLISTLFISLILIMKIFVIAEEDPQQNITIYEVYTSGSYISGSNNEAPYKNCYVVLYNNEDIAVDLSDYSIVSIEGNSTNIISKEKLTDTIEANGFYVVSLGPCTEPNEGFENLDGKELPFTSQDEFSDFNLSRKQGKIALCDSTFEFSDGQLSTENLSIVDFLGYCELASEPTNDFKGSAPANGNTVKNVLRRVSDTGDNGKDFKAVNISDYPLLVINYDEYAITQKPDVFIYEVYTSGGFISSSNNEAPYKNCYVALYNNTDQVLDLEDWALCYATGKADASSYTVAPLSGEIDAKRFLLIECSPCSDDKGYGEELPFTVERQIAQNIVMSRKDGRIALCNIVPEPGRPITSNSPFVVDFLGYGDKSGDVVDFRTSPALGISVKNTLRRVDNVNTNQNGVDFKLTNIFDNPDLVINYNENTTLVVAPELEFKTPSGFYEESFQLELSTTAEEGIIYYTLDGSSPLDSNGDLRTDAMIYSAAIEISDRTGDPTRIIDIEGTTSPYMGDSRFIWPPTGVEDSFYDSIFKVNTIRAVAEDTINGVFSQVVNKSYVVSSKTIGERFGGLPVISLTTDAGNLYNDGTDQNPLGIFMYSDGNEGFEGRGVEWERPVNVEFFESDGNLGFEGNMGLRINGGYTRRYPQKSLRLYAREGTLKYDLFNGAAFKANDDQLEEFDRFILRSSGNDWYAASIRDAFWQLYMGQHTDIDYQAYRPCIAFINGEFWGIYDIRERYDDKYFSSHYGIAASDVVLIENYTVLAEGNAGDERDFINLRNYVWENDMADPEKYQRFEDEFDVQNYLDYIISSIYVENLDWGINNIRLWRNKNSKNGNIDTKWRFVMVDVDQAFPGSPEHDTFGWVLNGANGTAGSDPTMLKSLLENKQFREQFVIRAEELMREAFDPAEMIASLDSMLKAVETATPEHRARWNLRDNDRESMIRVIKNFMNTRGSYMKNMVSEYCGGVFYECDSEFGEMTITNAAGESVTTSLAKDTVHIYVEPKAGYEVIGVNFTGYNGEVMFLEGNDHEQTPTAGGTYSAVFESSTQPINIEPIISTSYNHALVINAAGDLYGWGHAGYLQLGNAESIFSINIPKLLATRVKSSATGNRFSIYSKSDNKVYGIGNSEFILQGNGTMDSSARQIIKGDGEPLYADKVYAGSDQALVISPEKELFAFGGNNDKKIGSQYGNYVSIPVKIADNVISAAGGMYNTYYVTGDNELYFFGTTSGGRSANKASGQMIASGVKEVIASDDDTFYITTDGMLYGFGFNNSKILGSGGQPVGTPVLIAENVSTASISRTHLLYMTTDGNVYGLGNNSAGQLGQPASDDLIDEPVKIMDNCDTIGASTNVTFILTKSGSLKVMGQDTHGLRGSGLMEGNVSTPMELYKITPLKELTESNGEVSATIANYTGSFKLFNMIHSVYKDGQMDNLSLNVGGLKNGARESVLIKPDLVSDAENKVMLWEELMPIFNSPAIKITD